MRRQSTLWCVQAGRSLNRSRLVGSATSRPVCLGIRSTSQYTDGLRRYDATRTSRGRTMSYGGCCHSCREYAWFVTAGQTNTLTVSSRMYIRCSQTVTTLKTPLRQRHPAQKYSIDSPACRKNQRLPTDPQQMKEHLLEERAGRNRQTDGHRFGFTGVSRPLASGTTNFSGRRNVAIRGWSLHGLLPSRGHARVAHVSRPR